MLFQRMRSLERRREKKQLFVSYFSRSNKNTPTKESFNIRDTKPFFIRGGRQRRRCETTRNNKETDEETNNCGGSSPFCIFLFRAGVAPHLRFFLRFSFSSFFSPSSSFLHLCLVLLALVAPPVVLKTDFFSGKRIWRRKAERRGS